MEMEAPEMQYMNGMLRHKTPNLLLHIEFEEIFFL